MLEDAPGRNVAVDQQGRVCESLLQRLLPEIRAEQLEPRPQAVLRRSMTRELHARCRRSNVR